MQLLRIGVFDSDIILYNALQFDLFDALEASYAVFRVYNEVARGNIGERVDVCALFETLFTLVGVERAPA